MIIHPPVTFDNFKKFSPDGQAHTWDKISGYDATWQRITNIVGHDGQEFLKQCPSCDYVKPETAFGYDGRDTGEAKRRDQSYCTDCRSMY